MKPRTDGTSMNLESVDPATARAWLASSDTNFRAASPSRISDLAASIKRTGWVVDGSPIRFDSDGHLIDGQHRLRAITLLEITVKTWVCRGVNADGATTIDTGAKRTTANYLTAMGEKNATQLAAALALVWSHRHGVSMRHGRLPSTRDLIQQLKEEPALPEAVTKSMKVRNVMAPTPIAFIRHIAGPASDEFIDAVATGENLPAENPAMRLRARMIANRTTKAKLRPFEVLALAIKAWNLWYGSRSVRGTGLRWRTSGDKPEQFPDIVIPQDTAAVFD